MAPIGRKRKRDDRYGTLEELKFNPEERQEYLTGFSKRKQARKDHAKEVAIKREKEDKIKERKALREQKKQEVEEHVQAVNQELKKQNALINGSDDEASENDFDGFEEPTVVGATIEEGLPSDEEYVDEDKYTTVTVEAMDEESEAEDEQQAEKKQVDDTATKKREIVKKKRPWQKDGEDKKKQKKKKFRYESKAERAVTRQKQKSKNSKAASARKKSK